MKIQPASKTLVAAAAAAATVVALAGCGEVAQLPVAVADQREIRDIASVEVSLDRNRSLTLLFDPEHALDDRIAMEQFVT